MKDPALTEQDFWWTLFLPAPPPQVIHVVTKSVGVGAAIDRGGLVEEVGIELSPGYE